MINVKCCGIDSRTFHRSNPMTGATFLAGFGCAVIVDSYEKFKEKYNEVINDLFSKYSIQKNRKVYCTYLINYALKDPRKQIEFFEDFYTKIISSITELHLFYSYFGKKTPSVRVFTGKDSMELRPMDFLKKHIIHPFPHFCAHKLIMQDKKYRENTHIFIDDFGGKITRAWFDLEKCDNISIVFKGDTSNYCIATADMLLQSIDNRILEQRLTLDDSGLLMANKEISKKTKTHYIGNFSITSPISRDRMDKFKFLARPIVFVVDEQDPFITKKTIEHSIAFRKLFDYVADNHGSLKYYEKDHDNAIIKDGDRIFSMGESGDKVALILPRLGYNIKKIEKKDLGI